MPCLKRVDFLDDNRDNKNNGINRRQRENVTGVTLQQKQHPRWKRAQALSMLYSHLVTSVNTLFVITVVSVVVKNKRIIVFLLS